jgi:hypothetical protein
VSWLREATAAVDRDAVAELFVPRALLPAVDPFGESGPDEPEEFDPDSLGPETPEAPDVEPDLEETLGSIDEMDDELVTAFWGAAVFLNVALAAVSLGLMLLYFRGDWRNGGGALLVGVVAAVFAARYYLGYTRGDDEGWDSGAGGDHRETGDRPGGDG